MKKMTGEGEDVCGIRDPEADGQPYSYCPRYMPPTRAHLLAEQKTRSILDYFDLPFVTNLQERNEFLRKREALAEDLFQVFHQEEDGHNSRWAGSWTFLVIILLAGVIFIAALFKSRICPPTPSPVDYVVRTIVEEGKKFMDGMHNTTDRKWQEWMEESNRSFIEENFDSEIDRVFNATWPMLDYNLKKRNNFTFGRK